MRRVVRSFWARATGLAGSCENCQDGNPEKSYKGGFGVSHSSLKLEIFCKFLFDRSVCEHAVEFASSTYK